MREGTQAMWRRRWFQWALTFLGWTGVALFFASQTYLSYKYYCFGEACALPE